MASLARLCTTPRSQVRTLPRVRSYREPLRQIAMNASPWAASCPSERPAHGGVDIRPAVSECAPVHPQEVLMSWNLKGSYAETCSCELMCPCNLTFDHGATYDYCRATLAFNIREGSVDGTDIAGRKVVLIADTPKIMTEGNWKLGVLIDDGASDEQFNKLVNVFSGALG